MTDDTASTSRIPTSPPMAGLEEQPWFKTGTTMPPPSMRPSGESMMPAPRKPPNPRVLKIVFGVIAGCLFIVAIAGVKLVYKRVTAPPAPAATAETSAPKTALAEPTKTPSSENAPAASPPPSAPEPAPAAAPVAATAESAQRAAVRSTTPRAPAKTTTRRAPAPKKPVRGTH
jgi:cytoskeletal protein RodZ